MDNTAYVAMQLEADARALKATVFDNYLLKSSHPLVAEVAQAQKDYRKKVEGNSGHGLGPVDVHVWRVLVLYGIQKSKCESAVKAVLSEHAEVAVPSQLTMCISHLKMTECRRKPGQEGEHRFELGIKPMSPVFKVGVAVGQMLLFEGAKQCHGKAPRGFRTRQLSEAMDRLSLWSGPRSSSSARNGQDEEIEG